MTTRCYSGKAALAQVQDRQFRENWRRLFEACPWSTVHQRVEFADIWYSAYRAVFEPLLLTQEDESCGLTGLLALGRSRHTGELVPVGGGHSEYQVWLAEPSQSQQFIESALDHLVRMFPGGRLTFLFAPPGTPLQLGPRWRRRCEVRHFRRGLLSTIDDAAIKAWLKKIAKKSKLNQLKQLGSLTFRRVSDPDEAFKVLNEMEPFYDARQLAISGIAPFHEDPNKAPFYRSLLQSGGLLHVTEMRLDGRLIAAHIGPINQGQVILGMIAHSPFYAEYSVGTQHILMTAALMSQEGLRALDLTPGGEYKDRFATMADEVYVLTFFFRDVDAIIYAFRRMAIACLKHIVSTDRVKAALTALQQKRALIRPVEIPGRLLRRIQKWISHQSEFRIYRVPVSAAIPVGKRLCLRDSLDDLLHYEPSESWQPSRSAFIRTALERLAKGSHVYTMVLDGKLAHWGWLTEREDEAHLAEVRQTVPSWSPRSPITSWRYISIWPSG